MHPKNMKKGHPQKNGFKVPWPLLEILWYEKLLWLRFFLASMQHTHWFANECIKLPRLKNQKSKILKMSFLLPTGIGVLHIVHREVPLLLALFHRLLLSKHLLGDCRAELLLDFVIRHKDVFPTPLLIRCDTMRKHH